jgi:alkanesulfonate monooxygenase SsuD/methylene tetrahydromethanopterin reductase-like flavin-dependent oxidoreductase (luciferase family)
VLRERVLAMKKIWTEKEATFHGEYVNFDRIWADPKPAQKPHPPVIMGGDGATTFDRVVEYGDGWMPILRGNSNPVAKIPELHARLRQAGRDPKSASVSLFFAPLKREFLDEIAAKGVTRAIFGMPSEPRDKVLPRLDGYAKLIG